MSDKEIVIIGAGMHPFGRFPDETYGEIGRHAVREALKDAGIGWNAIEAAYCSTMYLPATAGARIMRPLGATGIPICDVEAACASGGVAIKQAIQGLQAGEYETALVLGVEKMPRGFMDPLCCTSAGRSRWACPPTPAIGRCARGAICMNTAPPSCTSPRWRTRATATA